MKNYAFSIKTLSVFLAILLFVMAIPLGVFARNADEVPTTDTTTQKSDPVLMGALDEAFEEISLREESVKHFRLADGSYMAFQYNSPIHILDTEGKWQDIDNHLIDQNSELASSDARIKFVKKITGNDEIFTLREGNRKLTTSLDGAIKKTVGEAINTETTFDESATLLQKLTTLDHLSTKVTYRDILDGVDLEYLVNGRNIKENLIVKSEDAGNSFSFTLKLNNMTATLADDGAVYLMDGETVCYIIPAPTVWDADGVYAEASDAFYTLESFENGSYRLTVTVSDAWMKADDRAYPVTIDPPIYSNTQSNIRDTYIYQSYYDEEMGTEPTVLLGKDLAGFPMIGLFKIVNLPELPKSATVVSSNFSLYCQNVDIYTTAMLSVLNVGLYAATSAWDEASTWAELPDYQTAPSNDLLVDYAQLNQSSYESVITWDVTELTRAWYSGTENNGIYLRDIEGPEIIATFSSREATSNRPVFEIQYRVINGIEDYYSYRTQSAGLAGTGYVNIATGQLTFTVSGYSTDDGLMPYTPTLVYNSLQKNQYFNNDFTNTTLSSCTGYGWKLDSQQSVVARAYRAGDNVMKTYYLWVDADGTEHAFIPFNSSNGTVYYDEDGLGLKFKITTSTPDGMYYQICDTHGNTLGFDVNGHLVKEVDSFGNQRLFNRSNGLVTSVSLKPNGGNAIEQVRFSYYTSGGTSVLTEIEYVGTNKRIRLYYSTSASGASCSQSSLGYLKKVEYCRYSGGTYTVDAMATYTYVAGLLNYATDVFSDQYIRYAYSGNKVSMIYEYSEDTLGQTVRFTYEGGKTVYRTSGSDDAYNTEDDLLTHFVFDNAYRTITTYMTDLNNQTIFGALNTDYIALPTGVPTSEQVKQNNKLNYTANISATSPNLLNNGGFESGTTSGWTVTNGASFTALTGAKNNGHYGARLQFGTSQTAAGVSQSVYLTEGVYTFSLNVRLLSASSATTIKLNVPTGATSIVTSDTLSYTSTTPLNSKFTSLSTTFEVTSAGDYTISLIATRASASYAITYYLDDVVMVHSENIGALSLLNNGGFEYSTSGLWSGTNVSRSESAAHTGMYGLSLNSTLRNACYALQQVPLLPSASISNIQGDINYNGINPRKSYVIGGWAKASAVKVRENRYFGIMAVLYYAVPGSEQLTAVTHYIPFNTETDEWQFTSLSIITDPIKGYPARLDIYLTYINNVGTAYFDDIVFTESTNTIDYTYDSEGRVTMSVNGNGYDTQHITYYDESDAEQGGEIESITYSDGRKVEYNYTQHRQSFMMEWDAAGNYIYDECYLFDSYGNVEYMIQSSQEGYSNWTGYTYSTNSAIFGKLLTEEDVTGLVTTYHYDTSTRYLMAVTLSDGTGTAYTYDALGRQLSARPATVTSSGGYQAESGSEQAIFTYTENALSTVTTGSTVYTFTYDAYKNRQSVKVGSGNIAYYIYNAKNGKLIYTVYANGYVTKNVYDALDRIAKVCYIEIEGTPPTTATAYDSYQFDELTSYRYDEAGNITEVVDHVSGEKTVYTYGSDGKPTQAVRYGGTGGTISAEFTQSASYDSFGQLSSTSGYYLLNNKRYTHNFAYIYDEQQRLTTMHYNSSSSSNTYSYTYDYLNRVNTRKLIYNGLVITQTFTYQEIENSINNNSTSRLESLTSKIGTTTTGYSYTYDDRGNITHIYIDGVLKYSYVYDNLNQLTRENNAAANKTYVYTYDDAGNILSKKTYAYTTGTLGSVQSTYSYTYGNSNWGDQLTAYRGASITYDTLGNPLSYYNGASFAFTWKGRQLESVYRYGTITYTYNADGIRTGKNIGGSMVEYLLDGTRIIGEKNGSYIIRYLYDPQGAPVGMNFDGTVYLYEKNLQGDVIGIYTTSGTKIATYVYDAWGKLVSSSYTSGYYDPFYYNPFRYRGYYYDTETGFYYLQSRYYDPATGRFLNADGHINANGDLQGFNMYAYCSNNPVNYIQRPVSSGGSVTSSSISVGGSSVLAGGTSGGGSLGGVGKPTAPWWASTAVGAIPDFILGMRYLAASGMHSRFAYATNTRYMHPIMGGTWRWFGKSSSSFGTVAQGTFKQILTGDARAGFGAIAKSVGGVVGLNALVNFGFNLYDNNWQVDSAMLVDTAIDTAIGVGSYYLAAGAMSLATAGLLAASVALPGIVVVGGVVILSIGFEHLIRAISGYWD